MSWKLFAGPKYGWFQAVNEVMKEVEIIEEQVAFTELKSRFPEATCRYS